MNKKILMALIVPAMVIAFAAIIGISASLRSGKDDGIIEEVAEEIIGFETDRIIDLTPDSKELGPIATEKIRDAWCANHCHKYDKQMDE